MGMGEDQATRGRMIPDHLAWPHPLRRRFRLLVVEWEGTAVDERNSPPADLAAAMESLLANGVLIAVISDLESDPIYRDCMERIVRELRRGLFAFTRSGTAVRRGVGELIQAKGIPIQDVALFGERLYPDDERSAGAASAPDFSLGDGVFCSVSGESPGLRDGVLSLSGGAARFFAFLRYQADFWSTGAKNLFEAPFIPPSDPAWCLVQDGFDPSREHEMESLFALGNGYLGVRSASGMPIPTSQSELYVAGIYDRKVAALPYSEVEFTAGEKRPSIYSEIVPFPSQLSFVVRVEGHELLPGSSRMKGHERILDLKAGALYETFTFEVAPGRSLLIRSVSVALLNKYHRVIQEIVFHTAGGPCEIELEMAPEVSDFALRYPHIHRKNLQISSTGTRVNTYETHASGYRVAFGTAWELNGVRKNERILKVRVHPGQQARVTKVASAYSSREVSVPEEAAAAECAGESSGEAIESVFARHRRHWEEFWRTADLRFVGRSETTQAMRFGLYHLRCAAPVLPWSSVGARGLTGRSYEGHVFWDAEIFLFPFYLVCLPEAAKNILLYRYLTLDGARKHARAQGCKGASYAWESTVDGSDVTPAYITLLQSKKKVPIFTGTQQIHATADVAHAVTRYWEVTHDEEFMKSFGLEILIETARFWASRVESRGEYFHILGVVGPDEYHHGVNDNAYTNWMAKRNVLAALDGIQWIRRHDRPKARQLAARLNVLPSELVRWRELVERIFTPQPDPSGVIEQFEGFFQLRDPLHKREDRVRAPVDRLLNWEKVGQSRLIKQADVLMIPFLFPDAFSKEVLRANFEYYEPLTDHGSSLSPCVYAAIAADLGLFDQADRYWEESLVLDLRDLMKNTPLGMHLGSIAGTWQALAFHSMNRRAAA